MLRLLCAARADVNIVDGKGRTPLHQAALESGIDKWPEDEQPEYAGIPAEFSGKGIRVLCDARADVNAVDAGGHSALHHALHTERSNTDVLRVLCEAGANPRQRNYRGTSALALTLLNAEDRLAYAGKELHADGDLRTPVCHLRYEYDLFRKVLLRRGRFVSGIRPRRLGYR